VFKKSNIGIYLDDITPAIGKDKEGDERRDLDLSFRIHPFSPELATELDAVVRSTLWTMGKVEISDKVKTVGFDLKLPAVAILFKAAPDATRVNIEVPYARVGNIAARKHKGIQGWALTFHAVFPMPDEHALALLHNGYKRQHFITFEAAAPDLIDAMEENPDNGKPLTRVFTDKDKKGGKGKEASDVH
jgi:hypothetical protein